MCLLRGVVWALNGYYYPCVVMCYTYFCLFNSGREDVGEDGGVCFKGGGLLRADGGCVIYPKQLKGMGGVLLFLVGCSCYLPQFYIPSYD